MKKVFLLAMILSMVIARAATVTLAWNPNSETNLTGYILYYGLSSGSYSESKKVPATDTSVAISNLSSSMTYYFAVTATNSAGLESVKSTEVSVAIPTPPPQPALNMTPQYFTDVNGNTTFTNLVISWNPILGTLEYNTDLTTTNWLPWISTNNPAIVNITERPQCFFRLRPFDAVVQPSFSLHSIASSVSVTSTNVFSFTNLPLSLLVMTAANESDNLTLTVKDSDGTNNWSLVRRAQATSSGGAEIWSKSFSGGNLKVTNYWNSAAKVGSSSVLVFRHATNGAVTSAVNQSAPSVSITTTKTNSFLVCVSSDWNARTGTITYRSTPVVEILKDTVSSKYQAAHWYKLTTNATSYTLGESAPTGQNAGIVVLEVKSK